MHCFAINMSELKTWQDSENTCRNISNHFAEGHLLSITSSEKDILIKELLKASNTSSHIATDIWIGLKSVKVEQESKLIYVSPRSVVTNMYFFASNGIKI